MRSALLVAPAVLATVSAAQEAIVLPASAASSDGNSAFIVAGFSFDARQQILVDADRLEPALVGHRLTGIEFRRDAALAAALRGGAATLTVTLSPAPHDAVSVAAEFAANQSSDPLERVVVFQGTVTLPSSTDPSGRSVTWSTAEDVVSVPFTTGYTYGGGHLCIDLVGYRVTGSEAGYWPVDAVSDASRGSVTKLGQPCGTLKRATSTGISMVPGSTAEVSVDGEIGTSVAFLFGTHFGPVDLAILGSPGCELHVLPTVAVPLTLEDRTRFKLPDGSGRIILQVPADPGVLSMTFAAQFVALTPTLSVSNGVHCTIAGSLPSLGMSSVWELIRNGVVPTVGDAFSGRAPAIRLTYAAQ